MDEEHGSAIAPVSQEDGMLSCVWESRREQDECARSDVSATSSRRSVASYRSMDQMADLAAMKERKTFASREEEIEKQRRSAEAELNQLRLDRDIAIAKARLQVYAKYENEEQEFLPSNRLTRLDDDIGDQLPCAKLIEQQQQKNMSNGARGRKESVPMLSVQQQQRVDMEVMMDEQKRHEIYSSLGQSSKAGVDRLNRFGLGGNDCRVSEKPDCTTDSVTGINKLVHSLNETIKRNQLPGLHLPVFNGDELDFQQWLVSFERIIEENTDDPARRLHYLVQYTAGNANTLVSGFLLDPLNGYQAAKRELKKEYGDPYVLSRAYLRRIDMWKSIPLNDVNALKTFGIFLKKCRGSMPSLRHLQQLNTDHYLQKIVMKLPLTLQGSWRKTVYAKEEDGEDIVFGDLVDFIDRQCQLARHPVFSSEALQEAEGRVKSDGSGKPFNFANSGRQTARATNVIPGSVAEVVLERPFVQDTESCKLCHREHDL